MVITSMKLYPTNTKGYNINQISHYKYKEDNVHLLFSISGIVQVHPDKLTRLKIMDVPTKTECIGGYEFLCDESKYVVDCEWFQIDKHHVAETVYKTFYRLRTGALVDLVVESKKSVKGTLPTLIYFVTKTNSLGHGVEEDIISLLTGLKSNPS